MTIGALILGAVGGFVAGILVGRRNTKKVEMAVAAYEKAANVVTGILKK